MTATTYTLSTQVDMPFDEAVRVVREELSTEGFGVLCEIDVQATLKTKINKEIESYVILGACNPSLAFQALSAEPELGTLLPCNVIVYQKEGQIFISAVDARRMLSLVENDELLPIAEDVSKRLGRVISRCSR